LLTGNRSDLYYTTANSSSTHGVMNQNSFISDCCCPPSFLFPVRTFLYMYNKKVCYTTGKRLFDFFFLLNFWSAVMYNGERGGEGTGREYESHCSAQVVIFHVI
jgi:hypothetical protein